MRRSGELTRSLTRGRWRGAQRAAPSGGGSPRRVAQRAVPQGGGWLGRPRIHLRIGATSGAPHSTLLEALMCSGKQLANMRYCPRVETARIRSRALKKCSHQNQTL